MANSGIYAITNTVNGNKYIGSAVNFKKRWQKHKRELNKNTHHSGYLQNAWNKYGADCFDFTVLECCEKELLIEREQFYIDSEYPEYNVCPTAGSCLGRVASEESRRKISEYMLNCPEDHRHKMSEAAKGKRHTDVAKQKMSEAHKGKYPSEETRRKMSEALKGNTRGLGHSHIASEETRRKISEAQKGNTNMLGKYHTDETKRKMSEASTGRKHTDEAIRKMSEAHKGRVVSEETKRKISERVVSDETKRKMSEAQQRRRQAEAQMQTQLEAA
jgi:predicted GIY-YIG superfamily endonuclease